MVTINSLDMLKSVIIGLSTQSTAAVGQKIMLFADDGTPIGKMQAPTGQQGTSVEFDENTQATATTEPSVTASAGTMGKLYLVGPENGTKYQWITIEDDSTTPSTYSWMSIGSTEVDLSQYVLIGDVVGDPVDAWEPGTAEEYIDDALARQDALIDARLTAQENAIKSYYGGGIVTVTTLPVSPASGNENKIHRVAGSTSYSDYMWDGTDFVPIATFTFPGIDNTPTPGSDNLVKSGGVAASVVYDISAANASGGVLATYADLTAALGTNGANVPEGIRKGGMSIKFVQNSDNRYVSFRYMETDAATAATFTNTANWQGISSKVRFDDNPVNGEAVVDYVGLPVEILKIQVADAYKSKLGSIEMKAGKTYKVAATCSDDGNMHINLCSGSSYYSQGTIYLTLTFTNGTTGVGMYTPEEDMTVNIMCKSQGHIHNLDVSVNVLSNQVVWTSEQSLSSTEKAQVLVNLGIDPINSGQFRGSAKVADCGSINFDNTNHKVIVAALLIAAPSSNARLAIEGQEVDYTFVTSSTDAWWFVYDLSNSAYAFKSSGTTTINDIVLASIRTYGAGTTNGRVNNVFWCAIENWSINGQNLATQVAALSNYGAQVDALQEGTFTSIIGRNIHRDAAVRAMGKKAVTTDILPLSFIHISDIHTKSNNYKCFESACEYYQNYSNIKAMIVTGDLVWDTYADPMTYYDTALQKTTKPVLNVVGNHDAGQYNSSIGLGSQSSDLECYNKYIAPYVENWSVVQPTNAATNGNSYYYKDFADEKVRLIVLCEFETEYELNDGGTALKYSREYRAMRQAQVTWLINTLTNTPNDYGVIVALHQPLGILANSDNAFVSFDLVGGYKFNVYSEDREWLAKIINAYATKASLTLSVTQTGAVVQNDATLNCNCDFTSVQSELICVVCGHVHRDYIGQLANYPAVKILCVGADNLLYTSGFQPRQAGTPSEDLFNVVNIDRNRKTIKVIRIGSDASVTGQVRDQMIMSYATSNS